MAALLTIVRRAGVLVAAMALTSLGNVAMADFSSTGTGSAFTKVGTLSAPSITSATPGAGTVALHWSAVTPPTGSGPVSYYVTRNGGAAAGDCPTAATPTSATSCTDSGLSKGSDSYTVTAVWQSWSATSASTSTNIDYGAVSQLVFSTQPDGSPTGGVAFPQQPVVTAEDAAGNTVTSYAGKVTLSIKSGTGTSGAKLTSCAGSLSGGVTAFAGCTIDKAGTDYQLTASDSTLSVDSDQFNVTAGPATQLVFSTQPDGSPTGGVAFPQQPTVAIEDAGGNVVTTDASTVTLSIASGTPTAGGPGALTGCTGTESAGVISFSGCAINTAGTGYKLHAVDGSLTATDSNAFNVTVGPAAQLVFTTQPDGSPNAGAAFPQQPVITAEDAGGNTVTGYAKAVSLSIKSGTGTSGATLNDCTSTLTNGVTSFSGCEISQAGTAYQLIATDTTTPAPLTVTSSPFNVASTVSASSVAEATGLASPLTTASITPASGSTYLIFVYCSGQNASCNGTSADASVSSPAFSSVTFDESIGTGTSKDCLQVFTATGSTTSGAVKVTGASGQSIGFVNVVQLSAGAKVENGPTFPPGTGSSSPATAALTNPPSTSGELVPVAVADGNGQTTISVEAPASGMSLLGSAQQSTTVKAVMSVYFDSTAQSSASFLLNPTAPLNGWATYAIEVG